LIRVLRIGKLPILAMLALVAAAEDDRMADDAAMTVRFGDEEPLLEFPSEGVTVSVPLTPVGDRLYRLDGVPVFAVSASFGDVIEAEQGEDGRLRFIRVAKHGGWRTYNFILPAHKIESELGQHMLAELAARGGHWERVFGGLLFVCIPPELDLDPAPWVAAVFRQD
jgi:hypothetical protein